MSTNDLVGSTLTFSATKIHKDSVQYPDNTPGAIDMRKMKSHSHLPSHGERSCSFWAASGSHPPFQPAETESNRRTRPRAPQLLGGSPEGPATKFGAK